MHVADVSSCVKGKGQVMHTVPCCPERKWHKDCMGRTLSFEDIAHHQRINAALRDTDRLI